MQEVFEKIIYKLQNLQKTEYAFMLIVCYALDKEIEIIRQAAAEYNNGWISCSEKLPENDGEYICTQEIHSLSTGKVIGSSVELVEFRDGIWRRAKHLKVIAWQPLPEQYQNNE